ncbi:UDP:flavonoid glycosyltransferase YjiC (YdhE family) [Angulomicrobium amanitiforme]|uniref:UDP:flavonoid glycosyltransferase YjiC (YdhE family) n=1 Tax=Ancylobacter amanitiformis TaxID=217069 RepID=A0ABU0LPU6_9HYPH|nr:UDP:flavonoid glycosyltransferase YjiC (YdhE family) [Ancylobacter amanitiformis]
MQPYIALALGLMARGHEVQIAGPVQFDVMVREHGIAFAALPGEFLALMDTPEGKDAIAGGGGFSAGLKLLKHARPLMRRLLDDEWAAVRAFAPDVIVHHPKAIAAPHIAEALACPHIRASPLPGFTPTADFPSPMLPFASLGPLNRASHALMIKGADWLFGKQIRDWRETSLGLAGRRSDAVRFLGTLYAYSPHVVPVPPDWGRDVLVSGYWFLDDERWRPSDALTAFLDAGEPPVYVGFGSMPGLDPPRMTTIVLEALARTGKRGLLATGGGALEAQRVPGNVHIIAGVPHDRLFPRVAATVHHGGAGTTAASLRAGKPAAICPFFGDQPFWARRVAELGVGPPTIHRRTLSAESLAAAITAMDDPEMRHRASTLGVAIRQEDGITAAVTFIESRVTGQAV